jgi:GxxExxY protein
MKDTNLTNLNTNETNILHKDICYRIVGCIYDARNLYGSGQKETVYQNALCELFDVKGIKYKREVPISIKSRLSGKSLGSYRLDFVIENKVIIEIKAMKFTPQKIQKQLYSYLYSTQWEVGYLVNLGSTEIYIKRVILTNNNKTTNK